MAVRSGGPATFGVTNVDRYPRFLRDFARGRRGTRIAMGARPERLPMHNVLRSNRILGRSVPFVLALVTAGCGSSGFDPSQAGHEPEKIASAAEGLQAGYWLPGIKVVGSLISYGAAQSVAAIRGVNVEPGSPNVSCGATFVSPHYAITASHCVKNITAKTGTFSVEQVVADQTLDQNALA